MSSHSIGDAVSVFRKRLQSPLLCAAMFVPGATPGCYAQHRKQGATRGATLNTKASDGPRRNERPQHLAVIRGGPDRPHVSSIDGARLGVVTSQLVAGARTAPCGHAFAASYIALVRAAGMLASAQEPQPSRTTPKLSSMRARDPAAAVAALGFDRSKARVRSQGFRTGDG
jgi:hypothetical protein